MLALNQKQIIKTWLLANAQQLNDQQAADALNAPAAPAFYVYRSSVAEAEIFRNNFDWTRVDNLTPGPARIWDWMFRSDGTITPANPAIRAGINAVWKGTSADLAVRATVYSHCYEAGTVADQLLVASGSGASPNQNGDGPGVRGYDSQVTAQDVIDSYNA